MTQDTPRADTDALGYNSPLAQEIHQIVTADATRFAERREAGASASMNGALEYTTPKIMDAVRRHVSTHTEVCADTDAVERVAHWFRHRDDGLRIADHPEAPTYGDIRALLRLALSPAPEATTGVERPVAADRECTVCGAVVAAWPSVMVCHCHEMPWKSRAAAADAQGEEREGEPCAFVDCPPGLFRWQGVLCFKSEYSTRPGQQDAYCVDSGEYFWGGTKGVLEARRALVVTPVALSTPARPVQVPSREEVARVIDPQSWDYHDTMRAMSRGERSTAIAPSLATADAILALLSPEAGA